MDLRLASGTTLALVLAWTTGAAAQDSAATPLLNASTAAQHARADEVGLEEIIVTAQRRAEPLQDVPVSVSAFSNKMLENTRLDTLTGLRGLVPGMTITRSGAALGTPQISLRGISLQDVVLSSESGVGFTIDGIPLALQRGVLLDSFDIERLEVLRGPQGLLFGKNTTGGTINAIRTRPDPNKAASGKVRATIGSYGRKEFEGVVMAPVIDEKLAAKAAIAIKKSNGDYRNIIDGGREGARDLRDYLLALVATPTDRTSFYLSFERLEDDSEIPPYVGPYTPNLIRLTGPVPDYFGGANAECLNPFLSVVCRPLSKSRNEVETHQFPAFLHMTALTFEAAHQLDDVRLVSLTGYREHRSAQISDFDGTRFALFRDPIRESGKQFSQELRAETGFDGPFNIVAGAFYMNYSFRDFQNPSLDISVLPDTDAGGNVILNPATGFPVYSTPPGVAYLNSLNGFRVAQHTRSAALFFQADYDVTEKLRLTFGARQTWDRKRTRFRLYAPVFSTVRDIDNLGPLLGDVDAKAKFKKLTPKVSAQYKFSDDVLTYASYSRGYNTGGFPGRPGDLAGAVTAYAPETMDAFEIGFKSEFLDRRVRLNVSAYYNTLKDKQEDVLSIVGVPPRNTTVTLNAAKARYKGVEVELALAPLRGWTINSSAGYLKAEYLNFTQNLGQGLADLTELKLRRTPKFTAGMLSDYVFDAGPGEIGFNAAIYYTSRYETNVLNDPRGSIPPVAKIDLGARYSFPVNSGLDIELAAFIKNVTNNTIYDGMSSGNSPFTIIEEVNPTVGRTWGASLTARF